MADRAELLRKRKELLLRRRELVTAQADVTQAVSDPDPTPVPEKPVNVNRGVDASTRFFLSSAETDDQRREILRNNGFTPVTLPSGDIGFQDAGELFSVDKAGPDLGDVTQFGDLAIRSAPIAALFAGKFGGIKDVALKSGLAGAAGQALSQSSAALGGAGEGVRSTLSTDAPASEPPGNEVANLVQRMAGLNPPVSGGGISTNIPGREFSFEGVNKGIDALVDDIFVPIAGAGIMDALFGGTFEAGAKLVRFLGAPGREGFERVLNSPGGEEALDVAVREGFFDDVPAAALSEGGLVDFLSRRARQSVRGRRTILEERRDRTQEAVNKLYNRVVEPLQPGNVPTSANSVIEGTMETVSKQLGKEGSIVSQFEAGEVLDRGVAETVESFRGSSGQLFNKIDQQVGQAPIVTQDIVDEITSALTKLDPRTDDSIIGFLKTMRGRIQGPALDAPAPMNIADFIAQRDTPAQVANPLTYSEVKNMTTDLGNRIDWRSVWREGPDAQSAKVYNRMREVLLEGAERFKPEIAPEIQAANKFFAENMKLFKSPIARAAKNQDAVPVFRQAFRTVENIQRAKKFTGKQFESMKMGFTQDLFGIAPDQSLLNVNMKKLRETVRKMGSEGGGDGRWQELYTDEEQATLLDVFGLVEKTQDILATRQGLLVDVLERSQNLTTQQPFPKAIKENIESFARNRNIDLNAPAGFNRETEMAGVQASIDDVLRDSLSPSELKQLGELRDVSRLIARSDVATGETAGDLAAPDARSFFQVLVDLFVAKPAARILTQPALKKWLTRGLVERQRGTIEKLGLPLFIGETERQRRSPQLQQPTQ